MVGLPGSGKTTQAKRLEEELGALRLTPDEWHIALFGQDFPGDNHDERHARVERLMWSVAERALRLGVSVILDFGFWSRAERDGLRRQAMRMGAGFKIHYMDVPLDELVRRVESRNERTEQEKSFRITRDDLVQWSEVFQPPTSEELE